MRTVLGALFARRRRVEMLHAVEAPTIPLNHTQPLLGKISVGLAERSLVELEGDLFVERSALGGEERDRRILHRREEGLLVEALLSLREHQRREPLKKLIREVRSATLEPWGTRGDLADCVE